MAAPALVGRLDYPAVVMRLQKEIRPPEMTIRRFGRAYESPLY
jgi:hypothetical protein